MEWVKTGESICTLEGWWERSWCRIRVGVGIRARLGNFAIGD